MSKVLSIVGPTAVGKTAFALEWARDFCQPSASLSYQGVHLISADSRQVYEGLELISGVDLGPEWQKKGSYWQHQQWPIKIFGVSSVKPTAEWSVAHFQMLAHQVIQQAEANQCLPVIVGGTGLYVTQLSNTDSRLHVPPNEAVRDKAEQMTLSELQDWLRTVDAEKLAQMNASDQHNPRRLVRAIEIALAESENLPTTELQQTETQLDQCLIGLNQQFEIIETRIKNRVAERVAAGAVAEIETLLLQYPNQKLPLYSATGVKPIIKFINGELSDEELLQLWTIQERQYAKRQLTWWKKRPEVNWFEVNQPSWKSKAYALIESWLAS